MATINYNPNTGAKLKKGETVTNKSTGQKVTQGTTFGAPGSYGSSSGGSSNSNPNNLNLYNPNTGQLLKQGETVNFNGQKVTQGTVFGSAGNYGYVPPANNIIPATNMGVNNQMNQKIEFPQAGSQEGDYSWIASALSPNNADGTPKNAQQVQNDQSNTNLAYLRSIMEAPPSSADAYRQAQKETGILQKQQLVGDLTGKLNTITAQGEANKLSVIGQGRGIPEAIIGGQQAQMARETAIEALPVAAQLNAAQGNLQMAEQNLNTLFKIYSDDATNKYNQKQKVNEAFFSILTGQQKAQLDKIEKAETRAYNEQQNDLQYARQLAGKAFENNQGTLGSQIAALNPTSKTYKADVAKLSAKINDPSKALDIAIKNQQLIKAQNDNNPVYSTGGTTATGKPPTEGQIANAGYADRINQANTIIDSKKNAFAKMNYAQFKLAESKNQIANSLLTPDQRQVAQAMRNFITAKLRKESGAAIAPSEFDDARLQYFPSLGDDAQTLANKKALRDSVLNNLIQGSGTAYTPSNTNTVNSYLDKAVIPSLNNLSTPSATNYWNSIMNP